MSSITIKIPLGDDGDRLRFDLAAFAGQLGQVVKLVDGDRTIRGILESVQVSPDGKTAMLTVVDDGGDVPLLQLGAMSDAARVWPPNGAR